VRIYYLIWSLPIVVVAMLVGSGKLPTYAAGLCGAALAMTVAMAAPPIAFGPAEAIVATMRGTWLAYLVGAVILGMPSVPKAKVPAKKA